MNCWQLCWPIFEIPNYLTLSTLNLPLSSLFTTSREFLLQFSTCSEWRWLEVGGKWEKDLVIIERVPWKSVFLKPLGAEIKSFFRDTKWCFDASWGFKDLISLVICAAIESLLWPTIPSQQIRSFHVHYFCYRLKIIYRIICSNRRCRHICPADTRRWTNTVLMLGQHQRRWADIITTLVQRLVPARYTDTMVVQCWASVADDGLTLNQHCVSVSR